MNNAILIYVVARFEAGLIFLVGGFINDYR